MAATWWHLEEFQLRRPSGRSESAKKQTFPPFPPQIIGKWWGFILREKGSRVIFQGECLTEGCVLLLRLLGTVTLDITCDRVRGSWPRLPAQPGEEE